MTQETTNKSAARLKRDLASIKDEVAKAHTMEPKMLYGATRIYVFREARQIAMYLCRRLTRGSYPDIALAFGKKNHCTVLHACKVVETQRAVSHAFNNRVATLLVRVQNRIAQEASAKTA